MNSKIINLNSYKDKIINDELKFKNIINFLQIKLLEEVSYKTDIEINKLYNRFDKLPGIKRIMNMGGRKNLDFYFYKLFLDKMLEQVILLDETKGESNTRISRIRSEMLNNLIVKYIPESKRKKLINNLKFREEFFSSILENYLYKCDKDEVKNYFEYRNENVEFFYDENGRPIEKYYSVRKTQKECPDISSDILGIIRFYEEKNIYFCEYIGEFNNFSLKILSDDKEEVEKILSSIEKVIENINLVNERIHEKLKGEMEELINNEVLQGEEQEYSQQKMFLEGIHKLTSDASNLISINIWPDGRLYLIYSCIGESEGKYVARIGVVGGKDVCEELFHLKYTE